MIRELRENKPELKSKNYSALKEKTLSPSWWKEGRNKE
jgi:hypothetical protein